MFNELISLVLGGVISTVIFFVYSAIHTKIKHLKLKKKFSLHQRLVYLKEVLHDVEIMLNNIDIEIMNDNQNVKCINYNCPMADSCNKYAKTKDFNSNETYKFFEFNNELEEFHCEQYERREI
jgi:hypothetical protein